jgi:thiosulfate/3-mercaptopyruvate sulfurtransferase
MTAGPLLPPDAAAALLAGGARAVDCRFDLADPGAGERAYLDAHLPGAVYAHLDRHLSDLSKAGRGRHPLPDATDFSRHLSRWGIAPDTFVIAYDHAQSAFAARLWWMLRAAGHERVAVLDGGLAAWTRAGLPLETEPSLPPPVHRTVAFDPAMTVDADLVDRIRLDPHRLLLDARPGPRFRGEVEPLDPVAGHVPGAVNRPVADNLEPDGRFKPAAMLRAEFDALLAGRPPSAVVSMCGSGVTACHTLLAMAAAGLHGARLYPGSWSEWCAQPGRAVATGDQ